MWTNHYINAQTTATPDKAPVSIPLNNQRILGVIPDYQTVRDSSQPIAPMSASQKWHLLLRESTDPFNIGGGAFGSALSQAGNETPKYGHGGVAFAERFGAAEADMGAQNLFSNGVLACLLHQDPRYFRKGVASGFLTRLTYSLSRIVVTREDSGKTAFNTSNILGMMMGIGFSNAYYPPASRTGAVMASRIGTSLVGDVVGNLMSEFWPDVQSRFFRRRHKKP